MDNKFYGIDVSKFDPTNSSAAEIRKWLFAIIDAELEKDPDERDYDLIKECSDFEAELPLSDTDIELSESDYVAGLERIKAQTNATEHKEAKILRPKETKILRPKKKTKKSIRIIAILAASLATLILSLTVAAAVQGVSLWQFVSENFRNILDMDPGDRLNDEGVTLLKYGERTEYASLEEAVKSTGYDVLYLSNLPRGVEVESVVVSDGDSTEDVVILYVTNNANLSVSIYSYSNSFYPNREDYTIYEDSIIDFYIAEKDDGSYQAIGLYNGMRYSIKYNNYDELINILNGIKEIEK